MAGIRGRDTKPEIALRKELHRRGLRYRLHAGGLPGKPDITFRQQKAAVMVHGCFWHRHANCRYATTPASNGTFWQKKFVENTSRDCRNLTALAQLGWRVAIVWECSIRKYGAGEIADEIVKWLASEETSVEV